MAAESSAEEPEKTAKPPAPKSKTPALDHFCRDLTVPEGGSDSEGLLKPVLGRETIIQRILQSFWRPNPESVLLSGQPGSGKSSVIRGLARAVMENRVPLQARKARVVQLDFFRILAGTKYRGQLEERLNAVFNELEFWSNTVLVLDDWDDVARDPSFTLTPTFLSSSLVQRRGKLLFTADERVVAGSPSLERGLRTIRLDPMSAAETRRLLAGLEEWYRHHHNCIVTDAAIDEAVSLAELYLPAQVAPGGPCWVLDEAVSLVAFDRSEQEAAAAADMEEQIRGVSARKEAAIQSQDFEAAASIRDEERKLQREREGALAQWRRTVPPVPIDPELIQRAVSQVTGLSVPHLAERRKAPSPARRAAAARSTGVPEFERLQTQSVLYGDDVNIRRGVAFVLLPHTDEFRQIFDHVIQPALEQNGLVAVKAEDIYQPGSILGQVWDAIRTAEVIIADVSGKNPNVIYELGLCYGLRRCPILLVRDPAELPFNLRNLRYIEYEDSAKGAAALKVRLSAAVEQFLSAVRAEPDPS